MKAGAPLPDGTVLTLVQYKAQVDAAGVAVGPKPDVRITGSRSGRARSASMPASR